MEGDHVGFAAEASGGADGAAETFEGVGVEDPDVGLADEGAEEREGEEIAAFFVHGGAVCGGETEERIGMRVAEDGDA